jgi:hypothetical protein
MFKCYMKHMKQKYIEDDNNQLLLESILLPADKISAACRGQLPNLAEISSKSKGTIGAG